MAVEGGGGHRRRRVGGCCGRFQCRRARSDVVKQLHCLPFCLLCCRQTPRRGVAARPRCMCVCGGGGGEGVGGARTGAILWDPSLHFVQHIAHAHKHSTLQCAWEQSLPPLLGPPCFEKVIRYIVPTQRCFKLKVGPLPNAICR